MMPIALGLEFAAAVVDHHPGVPILFLTDGPTASGVLDDPVIGLVAKPVGFEDLRTRLAELIDRAGRIASTRAVQDSPDQRAAADRGVVIGHGGRRIEPGGRLGVLPELDLPTVTWAGVAGFTGLTGSLAQSAGRSATPGSSATPGLSAVPGAAESIRLASLGLFAAGVANQVNNMLAVVSMRADLLADGADGQQPSPAAAEDIAAIAAATTRASGLVQQLMLFAGQRTLDRGPVDLAELVEQLRPRLDDVAGAPGTVAVASEPVVAVIGDHEHLERVILDLVRNALEATAPLPGSPRGDGGPRTPRVRLRVAPAPTGQVAYREPFRHFPGWAGGPAAVGVVLEVADDGPGMSAQVRARAVEPFFRAFTSDTGSGLGLSIVAGIVAQHGGRLDVDSTPGRGTRVRVTLPADPCFAPAATPVASTVSVSVPVPATASSHSGTTPGSRGLR